ncbi:uncharacterized protein G2W53_009780 [Senna tora]|uniref:Uncharacterized protein n=1 Tax=Senna tora TaxID=362788 RepID=A0A834WYQ5_9FABA|nr:uncharacterized protein G2W53_009780 [Senna tora]
MGGALIKSKHIPDDKSRSDLRNLHELQGKRLVAQVSQTRLFANRSGFDAPTGVFLAWEERETCLNIFRTTNRGRILETFTNYEAKDLLRNQTRRFALYSRTRVVLLLRLESSRHGRSVDHVLTYSGRQIAVGSKKPSRISRQKTCCASESNTSVRVVFENGSGSHAPIEVVFAWEERGSCLNIFQTKNRDGSGFDAPIGVVLACEERGSCLTIFRTKNRGRILETFTNYEEKDLLRNRLGMGGAWIMSQHIPDDKSRSDLRKLHKLRGKRLDAQVSQTRRFELYSRTGVVLMLRLESSRHGRSVDHVSTYSG